MSDLGKVLDPVADRLLLLVGVGAIIIDGSAPMWFAVARRWPARCSWPWPRLVLAALGARRIDVTWYGKAGTFCLMFAFPLFLAGSVDDGPGLDRSALGAAWALSRSPGWSSATSPLARTCRSAARRCASGRADPRPTEVSRMKAVIMAGGEGTRLRPLTSNLPKPMMPLANRPMMEHIVDLLRRHGFDEIVVTVAFMANAIRNYFGDGSEFGVRMATPPRRRRSAPPARCATPWPSSTSGSS